MHWSAFIHAQCCGLQCRILQCWRHALLCFLCSAAPLCDLQCNLLHCCAALRTAIQYSPVQCLFFDMQCSAVQCCSLDFGLRHAFLLTRFSSIDSSVTILDEITKFGRKKLGVGRNFLLPIIAQWLSVMFKKSAKFNWRPKFSLYSR
jgi:hypothetical protein